MSLRMERPDQYEEERKEEPESVKTGDTWTGPHSASRRVLYVRSIVHSFRSPREGGLHPVHNIALQKADQGGSERRRTKFSDQDEEERKEEPESVKTRDTWTGAGSALRLRSVDLFTMEGVPHPVHHIIDLEKADQRGSEIRRTELSEQDKEEWKEEPESVNTGDTWTGAGSALRLKSEDLYSMEEVPHPVHQIIDLEKAYQRGSETRRTELSDQDKEEWEEEPECGRAGDTRTGPRSASRKPHALRSLITLPMGENLSPAADDIDNDISDQHMSQTRRTGSSAWGDGPFIPKTFASWMGRERPTAHRKDDCDFPDQPRTSRSKIKRRKSAPEYACNVFGTWSAAAVWIMMALTVATSSLAGAVCIGTEVKLDKGEAVLRCPLPVNASATRQGIIVKHFPTPNSASEVMFCYWPTEKADEPECGSSDGFSLVGQLTDQVVAKVPVSRLMDSGAYKCQLYPLGDHNYFNPCHIHHFSDNDEGKRSAVMPTPEVSSTATDRSTPGQDPLIREVPPCVGQSGSVALTAAGLVLQVIIITLLVVSVLYPQNRKNLQKPVTSEEEPMNSLDETGVIPEPTLYPRLPSSRTPKKLQPSSPQSCNLDAVGGLTASAVGQAVLQAPTSGSSPSWSSL